MINNFNINLVYHKLSFLMFSTTISTASLTGLSFYVCANIPMSKKKGRMLIKAYGLSKNYINFI